MNEDLREGESLRRDTDRFLDHPAESTIQHHRNQGVKQGSAQPSANLISNPCQYKDTSLERRPEDPPDKKIA